MKAKERATLSYGERARQAANPVGRKLLELMEEKKTNICAGVDMTNRKDFLKMVKRIGEEVALVKTHMEIIDDFEWDMTGELTDLSREQNFLVFEDKKFSDIGNTARFQYTSGRLKIIEWAHAVSVNPAPGRAVVKALYEKARKKIASREPRGCVLVAQMTSKGNLFSREFTKKAVSIGEKNPKFVFGFIASSAGKKLRQVASLVSDKMVLMTPGIMLSVQTDNFGQVYSKPDKAVSLGADTLIVGRGIYQSSDPKKSAKKYKKIGWNAYRKRIG